MDLESAEKVEMSLSDAFDIQALKLRQLEKTHAANFAKAYLELCNRFGAEIVYNSFGIQTVELINGHRYPIELLLQKYQE